MLVKNPKPFYTGLALAASFVVVLILIFSPIFGGKNGLEYSDDIFNKLSKGSSYFIPGLAKKYEELQGKSLAVSFDLIKQDLVEKTTKVLNVAGLKVETQGTRLTIKGDLGIMAAKVLEDSDAVFKNEGRKVAQRYGLNEREVLAAWWDILNNMSKTFQKEKKVQELDVVNEVNRRAVEPAYNFYQVESQRVKDRMGTLIGLLVFYVLYTMWWGYAIFLLFDGVGLSMKKAKVKKEV
ncbi:MAG: hypothetical protein AB1641_25345 [Thermodesulfobacteriota bacterium]